MIGKHRNAGTNTRAMLAWKATIMASACAIILTSCGQSGTARGADINLTGTNQLATSQPDYGPGVDKIILELRTDQAQAIADVVTGTADLILNPLPPTAFNRIGAADLDKLQLHTIPAESWSILINPIPNAAPYTWPTASGQTSFNPLAIQEVRYALNWLFDRQQLVDEILDGHGVAGFTPLPPGLASTARYDAVPAGLGMSAAADGNRAIGEITDAMDAAARLPENKGRLLRAADGYWQYDGRPVTIKFLIRADDAAGRLPAGRYLANQLEKAGFRVQRLERDRSALASAYFSDPADLAFHIYTEAWAPRTGSPSWDLLIGQQYAPHSGNLPGGADPAWWQYRNPQLDELAKKITAYQYSSDEDHRADSQKAVEMGLRDSVRIYLAFLHDTYIANKGKFESPLFTAPVAGLNGRSLRTASILADGDSSRILRVLLLQAEDKRGLGSWDPASSEGFAEGYSKVIAELVSDAELGSDTELVPVAGTVPRWHNGIELGMDDITYAGKKGIGHAASHDTSQDAGQDSGKTAVWSNHIILPWDLYEVLIQLGAGNTSTSPRSGIHQGFDLLSPALVNAILGKYRSLLEQRWVPPVLEGLVDTEQAGRRYQASLSFIEEHGHALISNGPFMLASLDSTIGTAVLEAFQAYPYNTEYPERSPQD